MAFSAGRRVSRGAAESLRGVASRGADWRRERRTLGAEATRETARGSLRNSARALADQRYREARQTVERFEAPKSERSDGVSRQTAQRSPSVDGAAARAVGHPEGLAAAAAGPSRERYEEARGLIARAERNQSRLGERWSDRDLQRFAKEDRELLERSRDPADHAHRAGIERARFEALRGPERERAEVEIEKARKRDLRRLTVSESPQKIADRPRVAAERVRQGLEGSGSERRTQLQKLRRERRPSDHLAPRRNLSRGA
jgi:hypothetical protein